MDAVSIPFEKNLDSKVYEAHSINISPGKNMLKTIKQKAPFWFPCFFYIGNYEITRNAFIDSEVKTKKWTK